MSVIQFNSIECRYSGFDPRAYDNALLPSLGREEIFMTGNPPLENINSKIPSAEHQPTIIHEHNINIIFNY